MTKRLVIAMTLLGAVISLALAVPLGIVISDDQIENFVDGLEIETLGTASLMSSEPYIDWQSTADATAERTGARVVVVDSRSARGGIVVPQRGWRPRRARRRRRMDTRAR